MKTPAQILNEAATIVERGWTRGAEAQDDYGRIVDARSPEAVRWCATGAILKSSDDNPLGYMAAMDQMRCYLKKHYGGRSVYAWNDAFNRGGAPLVAHALREAATYE